MTGVNGTAITVQRGNNGTTAATHSLGASIYRYVPAPAIEEATVVLASLWFQWQDAGGVVKSKTIGDFKVDYVDGWPIPDVVAAIVRQHRRPAVMGLG